MSAGSQTSKNTDHDQTAQHRRRYEELLREAESIKGVSLWQDAWRRLRRNRAAMISLGFLVLMSISAVLTPLAPLQSPMASDLKNRQLKPPTLAAQTLTVGEQSLTEALQKFRAEINALKQKIASAEGEQKAALIKDVAERERRNHPYAALWHHPGFITSRLIDLRVMLFGNYSIPSVCGSDGLGRDVLSRLFWGARVSLIVGIVGTAVSLLIGVSYGATAGYCGGWVDNAMMRFVDVLYSVPFIFVVIFLITILSQDDIKREYLEPYGINQIMIFYVVIGAIYWLTMSRVVRGQVMSLKHEQFVDAARTTGAGGMRIIFRHLVPNVMGVVIVYLSLTIPAVMLFEAFLSFLGLGVSPPDVSWGLLINEGVQVITPIRTFWWLVLFPGLTLTLTLFALNFLGDGLRDALDPRMKNR